VPEGARVNALFTAGEESLGRQQNLNFPPIRALRSAEPLVNPGQTWTWHEQGSSLER
jgi:hypothetical protein